MADRGILFSAPMVRALLNGRKTQTRRLVKPPKGFVPEDDPHHWDIGFTNWWGIEFVCWPADEAVFRKVPLPHAVGDRLWVREQFVPDPSADSDAWDDWTASFYEWNGTGCRLDLVPPALRSPAHVLFKADPRWIGEQGFKWRPSIHMPRWASRLWLTVTDVRVQRLQQTSEADSIAEGVEPTGWEGADVCGHHRIAYRDLWDTLHGDPGTRWDDNPWIYALTFTVHKGNIDG